MPNHHFLDLKDVQPAALQRMVTAAANRKAGRAGLPKGAPDQDQPLTGHVLAMIFEKSSTRTRVSFDVAMRQLGGAAIVLDASNTQLGRGESIADTARVLSRMADAIMIRTDDHTKLLELAHHATVPVINGLTDLSHPCQIMADLLTLHEQGRSLTGAQVAWFGDCNNVLHSLIQAAGLFRFDLRIATPAGYLPDGATVAAAQGAGASVSITADPLAAARDADVLVTDTWVSMGQAHQQEKLAMLAPFQVNEALFAVARPNAVFLHCLPAHVGEEVSAEVFESPRSLVFDEAENRIHAQKSVLLWCQGLLN